MTDGDVYQPYRLETNDYIITWGMIQGGANSETMSWWRGKGRPHWPSLLTKASPPSDSHYFRRQIMKKHRKNCECCPVSLLIVRSQWLSWSQVLNCLKCRKIHTPCHVSVVVSVFVFVFVFVIVWVVVFWLVRSCIIITLIICPKGHKSLWSLFECVL